METAWVATYTHGKGGRVLGVNSEMDALPGIGHACGHNLIGIAGVAVACAAKAAMEQLNIDGKVVLLGTPGLSSCHIPLTAMGRSCIFDSGGRWIWKGETMGDGSIQRNGCLSHVCDPCLNISAVVLLLTHVRNRCHPAPGPLHSISLSSCLAVIRLEIEYTGHTCGLLKSVSYELILTLSPQCSRCIESLGRQECSGCSCSCIHEYCFTSPANQAYAPCAWHF